MRYTQEWPRAKTISNEILTSGKRKKGKFTNIFPERIPLFCSLFFAYKRSNVWPSEIVIVTLNGRFSSLIVKIKKQQKMESIIVMLRAFSPAHSF